MTTSSTSRPSSLSRLACRLALLVGLGGLTGGAWGASPPPAGLAAETAPTSAEALVATVRVGDMVFTRIDVLPFRKVAAATGSWTNHVGVVIGHDGPMPLVAESTFPWSRVTPMSDFVARSQAGRVAVRRLSRPLDAADQARLAAAAGRRLGIRYDTGFDLDSRGQFCSRFVHEVVEEALGERAGQVQTLAELLAEQPDTGLGFWRVWFLGRIPWERRTITPASLLRDPGLQWVFDGRVAGRGH